MVLGGMALAPRNSEIHDISTTSVFQHYKVFHQVKNADQIEPICSVFTASIILNKTGRSKIYYRLTTISVLPSAREPPTY
uniref:Uncharacterized protein n=1 Tax=Romanomermis culicivorax TaxID=13658 RepID=A0A915IAM2_ROMCU